jgi:hypothetical protein
VTPEIASMKNLVSFCTCHSFMFFSIFLYLPIFFFLSFFFHSVFFFSPLFAIPFVSVCLCFFFSHILSTYITIKNVLAKSFPTKWQAAKIFEQKEVDV